MKFLSLIFINLAFAASLVMGGQFAATTKPFEDVCKKNPQATVCQGSGNPENPNGPNSIYGPGSILAKATSLAALAVGVTSVIMVIIGGLKFTTSRGDSNAVNSARTTVLYAVIGLAIAAAAQSIVVFVINKL